MGAWGHKALDSDEGLDVVDFLMGYVSKEFPGTGDVNLKLSVLVDKMKKDGFFGESFDQIDFYYDHSAMALAELYFMFKHDGQLRYEDDEDESQDLKSRVKSFEGDKASFEFLLRYLMDIKNEVPDDDDEREIVELWKDSDSYPDWNQNLDDLIKWLHEELAKA